MTTFTATELKQNLWTVTDKAFISPIQITKHGRVILEMMTPQAREELVKAEVKKIVWREFLEEWEKAHKDYEETGLHTTFEEMTKWSESLGTDNPLKIPLCHK